MPTNNPNENRFFQTVRLTRSDIEYDNKLITDTKLNLLNIALANGWFDDDVETKVKIENHVIDTYADNSELHTFIIKRLP